MVCSASASVVHEVDDRQRRVPVHVDEWLATTNGLTFTYNNKMGFKEAERLGQEHVEHVK